jgi:uroporphyrinogen decarboxylase
MLLQAFRSGALARPPFWFLRQAGRYLPEYRELRQKEPDFLRFCYTPELTVEAALQPLRRYRPDAVILFSDILVIADAIGCQVDFVEKEGPRLQPVRREQEIEELESERAEEHLLPVFQAVRRLRESVPEEIALIGFAGAPWTVAVYIVEGRGGGEAEIVRCLAYKAPETFEKLIKVIVDATVVFLIRQIQFGADVVMLFDSWAGLLPETQFRRWVIEPTAEIVRQVRAAHPGVPVIGFPRGAGARYPEYIAGTGVDGVNLDATVPLRWARDELQKDCLIQGNLDNHLLVAGGCALEAEAERILQELGRGRLIFNLGHGILPQTPPENVARVAAYLRAWRHDGQSIVVGE